MHLENENLMHLGEHGSYQFACTHRASAVMVT